MHKEESPNLFILVVGFFIILVTIILFDMMFTPTIMRHLAPESNTTTQSITQNLIYQFSKAV